MRPLLRNYKNLAGAALNEDAPADASLIVNHDAANLVGLVRETCGEFGIDLTARSALLASITDHASNVLKMSRDLGAVPVGCFAHQMHLVVTDLLPFFAELSVILDKISSVVTFFRQSVIAAQALQAMCKKEEHVNWATTELVALDPSRKDVEPHQLPYRLKKRVPTRWNSTRDEAARYLVLHSAVAAVAPEVKLTHPVLSVHELSVLRVALTVLGKIADFSIFVQDSTVPQGGRVLTELIGLCTDLMNVQTPAAANDPTLAQFDKAFRAKAKDIIHDRFFSVSKGANLRELSRHAELYMFRSSSTEPHAPFAGLSGYCGYPTSPLDIYLGMTILDPRNQRFPTDYRAIFTVEPWLNLVPDSGVGMDRLKTFSFRLLVTLAVWQAQDLSDVAASRLFGTDEDTLEDELQRKESERFAGLVAHLQQHGKRARSAVSANAVNYAKKEVTSVIRSHS